MNVTFQTKHLQSENPPYKRPLFIKWTVDYGHQPIVLIYLVTHPHMSEINARYNFNHADSTFCISILVDAY